MFLPAISLLLALFTANQNSLTGAWYQKQGSIEHVLIFQDGYYSFTSFDKLNKKFIKTEGGTFKTGKATHHEWLYTNEEFNSSNKERVGKLSQIAFSLHNDGDLSISLGLEFDLIWTRIDNGASGLAGNWRITGRMRDGQMQPMQAGPRKTLKLLSGMRFQWMAINTETKEVFGTGGGTYTFKDGKYTENIEFFSRDSTRVGASLSFDGSLNNKVWTHKGLSSRGEPIHEEWSRE